MKGISEKRWQITARHPRAEKAKIHLQVNYLLLKRLFELIKLL